MSSASYVRIHRLTSVNPVISSTIMTETETTEKRKRGRPRGRHPDRRDVAIQVRWRPEQVTSLDPSLRALQDAERALGLSTVTARSPYLAALIEVALQRPEVLAETRRRVLARRGYASPPLAPE